MVKSLRTRKSKKSMRKSKKSMRKSKTTKRRQSKRTRRLGFRKNRRHHGGDFGGKEREDILNNLLQLPLKQDEIDRFMKIVNDYSSYLLKEENLQIVITIVNVIQDCVNASKKGKISPEQVSETIHRLSSMIVNTLGEPMDYSDTEDKDTEE